MRGPFLLLLEVPAREAFHCTSSIVRRAQTGSRRAPNRSRDGHTPILCLAARAQAKDASELCIWDARCLEDAPVARVMPPHRIPYGVHGNFLTPEELAAQWKR